MSFVACEQPQKASHKESREEGTHPLTTHPPPAHPNSTAHKMAVKTAAELPLTPCVACSPSSVTHTHPCLSYPAQYYVTGNLSRDLYDPGCRFKDPTTDVKGGCAGLLRCCLREESCRGRRTWLVCYRQAGSDEVLLANAYVHTRRVQPHHSSMTNLAAAHCTHCCCCGFLCAGVEPYTKAVAALFDPSVSKADLISSSVSGPNSITLRWRLEGKLKIGEEVLLLLWCCWTLLLEVITYKWILSPVVTVPIPSYRKRRVGWAGELQF